MSVYRDNMVCDRCAERDEIVADLHESIDDYAEVLRTDQQGDTI